MSKEIGPRERQLREWAEARATSAAKSSAPTTPKRVQAKKPVVAKQPVPLPPSETKRGRGRPKRDDGSPWEEAGISRAEWYRRQRGKT